MALRGGDDAHAAAAGGAQQRVALRRVQEGHAAALVRQERKEPGARERAFPLLAHLPEGAEDVAQRGHGAVVIGSECAGGVYDVLAEDSIFDGTDRGLRIKTRRGRGRAAIVDGIELRNVRMRGVGSAFVVNSFYWCDPDGRAPQVGDRAARPVDDGTPTVRNLRLVDVDCDRTAHAGVYVLGLPEQPVENISIRNLKLRFDADAEPGCPDMAESIRPVRALGIHLANVRGVQIHGLDMQGQEGDAVSGENVA